MESGAPCCSIVRKTISAILVSLNENQKGILENRMIVPARAFDSLSHVSFADISEVRQMVEVNRESLMALFEFNRTNSMEHNTQNQAIYSFDQLINQQKDKLGTTYKQHEAIIQKQLSKFANQAYDLEIKFNDFKTQISDIIKDASKEQAEIDKIAAEIEKKKKSEAAASMATSIFGTLFSIFTLNVAGIASGVGGALNAGAELSDINAGKYKPVDIPMRTTQILAFIQILNSPICGLNLTKTSISFDKDFDPYKSRDNFVHLKYSADDVFKQIRDLINYKLSFDNNEKLSEKVNTLHGYGHQMLATFEMQVNSKIAFATALFSAYDMQKRGQSIKAVSKINEKFENTFLDGSMDEAVHPEILNAVLECNRIHLRNLIKDLWSAMEYEEVSSIPFEMPNEDASILELSGSLDNLNEFMEQIKVTSGYSAFDVSYKRSLILCESKLSDSNCDIEDLQFFNDLKKNGEAEWNYYLDPAKEICQRERMHAFAMSMTGLNLNVDEQIDVFIKSNQREVYLSPFTEKLMIVNMDSLQLTQKVHSMIYHKVYGNVDRSRMIWDNETEPDWSQEFCIAGKSICPSPYKTWSVSVHQKDLKALQNVNQIIFHFDLRGRCDLLTRNHQPTILNSNNLSSEYYSVTYHSSNMNTFISGTAITATIYLAVAAFSIAIFWINRHLTVSWIQ